MLMGYEITRNLPLEDVEVETPLTKMIGKRIAGKKLGIIPILRAGLGMVNGMLSLIPTAKVGHIGLYRDPETLKPVEYYCKLPSDVGERDFIVTDPMLATALAAITCIKGPPWMPGKMALSIALAYFSLQRIIPPRGPRNVL